MNKELIIHVTESLKFLESILNSTSLLLSYSKEEFCIGSQKVSRAAHPMVCFCQHNIDELNSKKITYGRYGIAFSRDWALKKGISPVLYIDGNSSAAKGLATLLRARRDKDKQLSNDLRIAIMEIKCFTKNVRGFNSKLKIYDFDFKDENEWRYVPSKSQIDGNLISQKISTYKKNQERYNKKLLPYPLKFNLSDVEAIFVATKSEVTKIQNKFSIDSNKIQVSNWKT